MKQVYLIFIVFFFGCQSKQTTDESTKIIKVDLNSPQKASLFDYFKSIELIPLETNSDVLIGSPRKMIYHQNRYYIFDKHRNKHVVHIFDDWGKFIFNIDKRGNGPGEYTYIDDMIINPLTGNIDLLSPFGWVYSYDLFGNYVKTSDKITDSELKAIHNMIVIDEKASVYYSASNPLQIIYYNTEDNKVLRQEYKENYFISSFSTYYPFYEYNGKWHFYRTFDNSTYELGSDSLTVAYTWDFGKLNYNPNSVGSGITSFSSISRAEYGEMVVEHTKLLPYRFRIQCQNDRYIIAQIILENTDYFNGKGTLKLGYLVYDKSAQKCIFIKNFDEAVRFYPMITTNEYALSFCKHEELELYVNKEMLDETNRQKFEDLINAKEEENPIIIKYYFK